jgi:phage gp46-like protein
MDVLLFQTPDGGEISCANGQITLTEGLDTAAYIALFGGNSDDSGLTADDSKQWWGNFDETDPDKRLRGQLQRLLNTLPLIPANLQRFEEAAVADLEWMKQSVADSIAARATMPGIDQVKIEIVTVIDGKTTKFSVTPPGKSQ